MELFITNLFTQPAFYVSVVVTFAGSICVHEFCHAFVAHRLGDDTAKEGGFMTLNPLKVMGWMSIAALLIFGFSWGAVPVKREDPSRLRRAAISLAGPLSNLALLGIATLLLKWLYASAPVVTEEGFIYYCRLFLICALYANAILFLFNILPIPVLDGWGIIEPFLPKFLIPGEKSKGAIFKVFIYIVCFSSASGIFDKALEFFASRFLPSQISAMSIVAEGEKCLEAKDYSGAYKAFEKAAEQGCPQGKLDLAVCLFEGYGCKADPEKAFSLFSEKDVCVFPVARLYLGIMSMSGSGCPQDQSKAFTLLNDGEIIRLSPVARYYVAALLMKGEVCEKDETRAFSLMNDKEVLNALPSAKFLLGLWYFTGSGTKQDFEKAAQLLKEAADAGEPNAVQFLGYQDGKMPDYGMPLKMHLKRLWEESR